MLRAIVDVDATLYPFHQPLHEAFIKICPEFPTPDKWNLWGIEDLGFLTHDEMVPIFEEIHSRQEEFGPFPEAQRMLRTLVQKGFYITIASHRSDKWKVQLLNWLDKYKLPFDEIHVSWDKTVLFSDCDLIIDDSPHTLQSAKEYGVTGIGLRYPWNDNQGFTLFDSISDIIKYIKRNYTF
jgi:FMN phosphatase YigB (HAD superfamily)